MKQLKKDWRNSGVIIQMEGLKLRGLWHLTLLMMNMFLWLAYLELRLINIQFRLAGQVKRKPVQVLISLLANLLKAVHWVVRSLTGLMPKKVQDLLK